MTSNRGHWLCPTGPYSGYIEPRLNLDPVLRSPDERNSECPLWARKARVTVLAISTRDGKNQCSRTDLDSARELKVHIERESSDSYEPCGRIFIMENMSHDFISYLGYLFRIPPRFFVEHERNQLTFQDNYKAQLTPQLKSVENQSTTHVIRYYELQDLGLKPPSFYLRCAETGRHVSAQIVNGGWEEVGVLKRYCSYWSNDTGTNKCWNVVILSDPPLTQLRIGRYPSDKVVEVSAKNFQGGYIDFFDSNIKDLQGSPQGPGRKSLREDFCYYVTRLAADDLTSSRSEFTRKLLHKIVASHYVCFLDYERSIVDEHEWYMSNQSRQDLDIFRQREVEQDWGYLQLVNRRLIAYIGDINDILLLYARLRLNNQLSGNSLEGSVQDFQAIADGLALLNPRVEQLINSMTGLASIVGNKQAIRESRRSLREAKSVKTLTTLGMIFAPLALVCGLFSMHSFYSPGSGHFWLYFAVGIPLVVLVFAVVHVIDLGYEEDRDWSLIKLCQMLGVSSRWA